MYYQSNLVTYFEFGPPCLILKPNRLN